jgi:hypothetical protein
MNKIYTLLLVLLGFVAAQAQVAVAGGLSGNGSYTTLGAAFTAIGTSQAAANITVTLTANTTEAASGATLGAGTWNSLTINATGFTVTGAVSAGSSLIKLNGSDKVTINGGIFSNTTVSATTGSATLNLVLDATFNTFNNCTFKSAYTSTGNGGCVWLSTSVAGNNNNKFDGCTFTSVSAASFTTLGIKDVPTATSLATVNKYITINNCQFVDIFSPTTGSYAVNTSNAHRWTVTNNKYYQTTPKTATTTATHYGFYLYPFGASYSDSLTFSGNTIGYANASGTGYTVFQNTTTAYASFYPTYGLGTNNQVANPCIITNNTIANITFNNSQIVASSFYCYYYGTYNATTNLKSWTTFRNNTIKNIKFRNCSGTGYLCYGPSYYQLTDTVENNTIDSITCDTSTITLYGLYLVGPDSNRYVNNNKVTCIYRNGASGTTYGIYNTTTYKRLDFINNKLDNITHGPLYASGTLYGLYPSPSGIYSNIQNDTVSNITWQNPTNTASVYPFYIGSGLTNVFQNNLLYNINNASTAASTNYGIYSTNSTTNGVNLIKNNKIYNLTTGNATSSSGSIYGIYGNYNYRAENNKINDILYGRVMSGIYTGTSGATYYDTLVGNTIYNITTNDTGGTSSVGQAFGITFSSTGNHIAWNNMISGLSFPNCKNRLNPVVGINVNGATTCRLFNNTVYIGTAASPITSTATGTGITFGGAGITFPAGTSGVEYRNNICNINGIPKGSGTFVGMKAFANGTANTAPAAVTMSNNVLNVNAHANNWLIGEGADTGLYNAVSSNPAANISVAKNRTYDGAFNTACSPYKSTIAGTALAAASFQEDNLISAGTGRYVPSGASVAESGATAAITPAVTVDIDGIARVAPSDIGALEFSGSSTDVSGPTFAFTPLANQNCASKSPTLSVNIADYTGIQTTTGLAPRLYYKLSNDLDTTIKNSTTNNNTNTGWKYVESTSTANPYTFTFDYTLLSVAPVANDQVQYFLAAQDLVFPANVSVNSANIYPGGICLTDCDLGANLSIAGAKSTKSYSILPPPTIYMSAAPTTVCTSNADTLKMVIGSPSIGNIGTGGSTTTTYGYSPFYGGYGGQKTQWIIRASELTALGYVAGNMTDLAMNISTAVATPYQGFTIQMGNTTATDFPSSASFLTTPMTMVYYNATGQTTTVGWNTYTFGTGAGTSPSFYWNGVDNVVISTCWSNTNTSNTSASTYYNTVAYNSTLSLIVSSQTAATVCGATSTSSITGTSYMYTGTSRPNFRITGIKGTSMASYDWSYIGVTQATTNPAYVSPAFPGGVTSMTYDATATDATGCSFTGTTTVIKNTTTPLISSSTLNSFAPCYGDSVKITTITQDGCPPYTYNYTFTPLGGSATPVTLSSTGKYFPTVSGTFNVTVTDNAGQTNSLSLTPMTVLAAPSAAPVSRCGTGPVSMTATGSTGSVYNWYQASTGGAKVFTGPTYSPIVTGSTNYYVESANNAYASGGRIIIPTVGSSLITSPRGIIFDATKSFIIDSLTFPSTTTAAYTVTVSLYNAGGTAKIGSDYVLNVPASGGTTTVPAMLTVPTGGIIIPSTGTYRLFVTAYGAGANLYYEYSGVTGYPYPVGSSASITGSVTSLTGTASLTTYYFFYKMSVTEVCGSPRTQVPVTVSTPPAFSSRTDKTVCNNTGEKLSVLVGLTGYDTFTWSPQTNLYLDAAGTVPYTGTNDSVVYFKKATDGVHSFVVNASNPTGCAIKDTVTFTNMPAMTLTSIPNKVCYAGNASLSLNPTSNIGAGTFAWKKSIVSATGPWTAMPSSSGTSTGEYITDSTYFAVDITDGTVPCALNPTVLVEVNKPALASSTPASRCGFGTVDLMASATTAGVGLSWYDTIVGGISKGTGTVYTTPNISATKDFYVAATSNSQSSGGKSTASYYGSYYTYGQKFTVTNEMILDSISVYVGTATSSVTLPLNRVYYTVFASDYTTVIAKDSFNVPAGSITSAVKAVVPINKSFAPGTYYITQTAGTYLWYEYISSAINWPYPYLVGTGTTITAGTLGSSTDYAYYYAFGYDWYITEKCSSPRTAVTATVTPPPAINITVSPKDTICNGSSATLNVSSTNSGYIYTWNNGIGISSAPVVSPTATTTYTVTAADYSTGPSNGCATTATKTITVMPTPSAMTLDKYIDSSACTPESKSFKIIAGGNIDGVKTLGAFGTTNVTGTAYTGGHPVTPYSGYYRGHRTQYLILASELLAQGFLPNSKIKDLTFNVTFTSTYQVAILHYDYTIKLGHTSATALSGYSALTNSTTVFGPSNISSVPPLGLNTFTFTSTFTWNGTSNLIVEICHDNNNMTTPTFNGNSHVSMTPTTFNSVYGSYQDAIMTPGVCSNTASSVVTSTSRPDMKFTTEVPATRAWTPSSTLWLDTAATTAYAGSPAKVFAKPSIATKYYVTSSTPFGCFSKDSVQYLFKSVNDSIVLPSGTAVACTPQCTTNDGWTYYANSPNKLVFAINKGTSGMTGETINMEVLGAIPSSTSTNGTNKEHASYFMSRGWDVSGTVPTGSVSIRFYYSPADSAAVATQRNTDLAALIVSNPSTLAVATPFQWFKSSGTPYNAAWRASVLGNIFPSSHIKLTPSAFGTVNATTSYVEFAGITSFSGGSGGAGFSYPGAGGGVGLPVTWASFDVTAMESGNRLTWSTASEKNADYFQVEYSYDATNFTTLAEKIKAAGNSNVVKNYSASHPDFSTYVYYRIKQVDVDGRVDYSVVKSVKRTKVATFNVSVFPIPLEKDNILNVKISSVDKSTLVMKMTDITGKIIKSKSYTPNTESISESFDMSNLSTGIYFIEVKNAQGKQVVKVTK